MQFQDFPIILGKSWRYEIHPPKLCASLALDADAAAGTSAAHVLTTRSRFGMSSASGVLFVQGDIESYQIWAFLRSRTKTFALQVAKHYVPNVQIICNNFHYPYQVQVIVCFRKCFQGGVYVALQILSNLM